MTTITTTKTAVISECGKFRYRLGRRWSEGPTLLYVMLNPSTANADEDDATIRRCIGFAQRGGFGALEVVNLYAYRATKPADMRAAADPIGPENDRHIVEHCTDWDGQSAVCCAWGGNARMDSPRVRQVLKMLADSGNTPMALAINLDGTPAHPCMLGYNLEDGTPRKLQPLVTS